MSQEDRTPTPPGAALIEAAQQSLVGHPSLEELAAYHEERLPPAEIGALQEHIARCRRCAEELLELASFGEGELEEGESPTGAGPVPDWSTMRQRVVREGFPGPASSRQTALPPEGSGGTPARNRQPWVIAACILLLTTVGFAVWGIWTSQQLALERAPRVNVPVADLLPLGLDLVREWSDEEAVVFPRGAEELVVVLNLIGLPAAQELRLEVLRLTGGGEEELVWQKDALEPLPPGDVLNVRLPRGFLPAGDYRLRLSPGGEGAQEPVEYALRLKYE